MSQAAIAQVFVVVLMVLGMTISLSRRQVLSTVAKLQESEAVLAVRAEELDLVMAHLEDGIAIIEEGGAILHTNKALRTAFGSREDEPVDRVQGPDENAGQAFHPDGRPLEEHENPLLRALAGESDRDRGDLPHRRVRRGPLARGALPSRCPTRSTPPRAP